MTGYFDGANRVFTASELDVAMSHGCVLWGVVTLLALPHDVREVTFATRVQNVNHPISAAPGHKGVLAWLRNLAAQGHVPVKRYSVSPANADT